MSSCSSLGLLFGEVGGSGVDQLVVAGDQRTVRADESVCCFPEVTCG
jgi:hypothetical protein